jgi:ribonuclease HI
MELTAAIKALEELDGPLKFILYADSEYLQKGITEWLENCKSNGWKNAKRNPVKNRDLWERLVSL